MLKITTIPGNGEVVRLRIEGRVAGDAIGEVQAACGQALAGGHDLLVDVSGVRFVDRVGVDVLHGLVERGALLVGCSPFLDELLRAKKTAAPAGQPDGEPALVARLRAGDAAAFETMVRRYGGRLLSVATRLLRSDADARDALQDAFLAAFRAIDGFAGDARLSTWLHRIVVNTALMKLRSRRRRGEESIEDLLPRFDEQGGWAEPAGHWETSSDVLLERRQTRTLVRAAIDRLPEAYRTVLLLRDIEELDTEEAAVVLGTTTAAVKTRLHRARQALRTLLVRDFAGREPEPLTDVA